MRTIDLETWARREHFVKFSSFDHPHWGLCANVDVTALYEGAKRRDVPITVAIVYGIARSANEVPEFRQRIRDGQVVEHAVVHPSITVLTAGDLFGFCLMPYTVDFPAFAADACQRLEAAKRSRTLKDPPGRDDLLFMTALPWVAFTSFQHPMHLDPADSVPRFAWGKVEEHEGRRVMPLAVQGHHGLIDGIHVGRFYEIAQGLLDDSSFW